MINCVPELVFGCPQARRALCNLECQKKISTVLVRRTPTWWRSRKQTPASACVHNDEDEENDDEDDGGGGRRPASSSHKQDKQCRF
jgi:hypothetical protein